MPASAYLEPKLLDTLFGNVVGAVNQTIANQSGTTSVTTAITVKGASGAAGLDLTIPAASLLLIVTPGGAGTENAFTAPDLYVSSGANASGATTLNVVSRTNNNARAANDLIILLGPVGALSPVVLPNTLYIGLSTGLATAAVAEPTIGTGGYARIKTTNNVVNWTASTGSNPATKANGPILAFPASSAAWSTGSTNLQSFFVTDASTAGNVLFQANLTTPQTVNAAGITPQFAAAALTITAT